MLHGPTTSSPFTILTHRVALCIKCETCCSRYMVLYHLVVQHNNNSPPTITLPPRGSLNTIRSIPHWQLLTITHSQCQCCVLHAMGICHCALHDLLWYYFFISKTHTLQHHILYSSAPTHISTPPQCGVHHTINFHLRQPGAAFDLCVIDALVL